MSTNLFASLKRAFDWCLATKWKARLFLLFVGAIYPLAFAPFNAWPLTFISLTLLCLTLIEQRSISAFQIGYCWGLGCFLVGASWVYVSIQEHGHVPMPGAALLTLVFVGFLAIFKGLFGYLTSILLRRAGRTLLLLIAPFVWLLSEAIQSTLLNGFPWLLTGYSQTISPFAAVATWLGVYGISWLVMFCCAGLALLFYAQRPRTFLWPQVFVVTTLLLANVHYWSIAKASPVIKQLDVALVQPNILQAQKWDRAFFGQIVGILKSESRPLWGADLVVWPEGAIPAFAHQVEDITQELAEIARNNGSALVIGMVEHDFETQQSFVALKSFGQEQKTYHKQILVPFGEYVPLQDWLRGVIRFLDLPMSGFTEAIINTRSMDIGEMIMVPAICYEIAYPEIIRKLAIQDTTKPQVIVTVSNEAWFGDSLGPYQHLQMAQMRAIELGIPLVRSTNDGLTAIINAKGKVIAQLPRFKQLSLRSKLAVRNIPTLYRQLGFTGLGVILLISFLFITKAFIANNAEN